MKLEGVIYCGDNLYWMTRLPDEFVDLYYTKEPQIRDKISLNTHSNTETTSGEE